MAEMSVVKYAHEGERFEILVKPDPALDFKLGKRADISQVLVSDEIYSDSGRGTRASAEKLQKAFKTGDAAAIAEHILRHGDLGLTTDQRRKMVEEKRKRIVDEISRTYVDPRSHLPHPPTRIEQAMKDARTSIDPQKPIPEQVTRIVDELRSVIPLKSETLSLEVTVPAQYAAQSYSALKSAGSLRREDWLSNGSLRAILEIPAASRPGVLDRLASVTKGTATAEMVK
ncbi:MAG: ribosome assembly factor SBDS [Thaumarchaeota archaeon]|nr:ribosome assembly factor SBDS [Nitrososphaerota archaeon]RNJ73142.1 MAG: ribosome assembly factor SBDS [Thaumarchaeota archaeon S13]RNJ73606.1 MAG: ribosome assembly factor SBDS [Thaumarchaeota archaeon S14]RNJ76171.1 MAG: ribosome assembly factor SBDS [Thaumarchaeota archaeon S15]MDD9808841.1 ribosome assembly factor SBDS [Nitrososphaerota archaeon]